MLPDGESSSSAHLLSGSVRVTKHQVGRDSSLVTGQTPDSEVRIVRIGCLKIEKFKKFFPLNKKDHVMSMRNSEKFALEKCGSVRYRDSALPYMKRLLNKYQSVKNKLVKAISVPMNYGTTSPNH